MHLIEIFVPLPSGDAEHDGHSAVRRIVRDLTERFGGATAFTRTPAEGLWKDGDKGEVERDDIVVIEVMAEDLDRGWWTQFRERLETELEQDEILIRTTECERI